MRKKLESIQPTIVVTRHKLTDGYSDDVVHTLTSAFLLPKTKVVVLLPAGVGAAQEARQVAIGADSVHRDPVRVDVVVEYLAKYRRQAMDAKARPKRIIPRRSSDFAGATIDWRERHLVHRGKSAVLTPREIQLVELLLESQGEILTYDTIYHEIFGRRFNGETVNIRVLLALLARKATAVGIRLRDSVEVVIKNGYRYREIGRAHRRPSRRA